MSYDAKVIARLLSILAKVNKSEQRNTYNILIKNRLSGFNFFNLNAANSSSIEVI